MNESKAKWSIFNNPLVLEGSKKKAILDMAEYYLPYSCGMEIECVHKPGFVNTFKDIPDIMDVQNNDPEYEQRYRIPNGLKGLVCLFRICEQLREQCLFHPKSGHHYHIDCTDVYNYSEKFQVLTENGDWILNELDSWDYRGDYNSRSTGSWFRWNGLGTLEFRIGNQSFDYEVIVRRLIHACDITRRLKLLMQKSPEELRLEQLKEEMDKTNELFKKNEVNIPTANELIKKRVIRI